MPQAVETDLEALAGKYLTFELGAEEFGLEILKVQEIIGMLKVTRVPRAPEHVRGVVNLRGRVIPVVDLRHKFGLEPQEDTPRTCIIVVQVAQNDAPVTMGLIVDEVCEVRDIEGSQVEPTPDFGAKVDSKFILGMGKVGDRVVMLLDVDSVMTRRELTFSDSTHSTD